jgi:hypothetical protein
MRRWSLERQHRLIPDVHFGDEIARIHPSTWRVHWVPKASGETLCGIPLGEEAWHWHELEGTQCWRGRRRVYPTHCQTCTRMHNANVARLAQLNRDVAGVVAYHVQLPDGAT